MSRHRLLLSATIVGFLVGGTGMWVTRQINAQLQHSRSQAEALRLELATIRRELQAVRSELAESRAKLTATEQDAANESARLGERGNEIIHRLAKLRELRGRFAAHPDQQIPELALLSNVDWLDLAQRLSFTDETTTRESFAKVRTFAKGAFASELGNALRKYLAANNGILPLDLRQLVPYSEKPLPFAAFDRYELRASGRSSQVPPSENAITERVPVDPEFDSRTKISARGNPGASSPWFMAELGEDIAQASRLVGRGHLETETDAEHLLPLLKTSFAKDWVQAWAQCAKVGAHGYPNPDQLLKYLKDPTVRGYVERAARRN